MSARGLEALFAIHEARWTTHGWERTYQVMHCYGDCDWRLRQKNSMSDDDCHAQHRAHVAAEVRAWLSEQLADEGLREAVKDSIDDVVLAAIMAGGIADISDAATAALTAVRDHLTTHARPEAALGAEHDAGESGGA